MARFLAFFAGGASAAGLLYIVGAALMMVLVPRIAEGGRQVVAMPWPMYFGIPQALAAIVGLGGGLFLPVERKARLAFLLGVAVAVFVSSSCCLDLLRRDYIGKF